MHAKKALIKLIAMLIIDGVNLTIVLMAVIAKVMRNATIIFVAVIAELMTNPTIEPMHLWKKKSQLLKLQILEHSEGRLYTVILHFVHGGHTSYYRVYQ